MGKDFSGQKARKANSIGLAFRPHQVRLGSRSGLGGWKSLDSKGKFRNRAVRPLPPASEHLVLTTEGPILLPSPAIAMRSSRLPTLRY